MPIVVGVDAGGTYTRAVAAGDEVVGEHAGLSANVRTAGVDQAADIIVAVVRGALAGASVSAVHVGASGAGTDEVARSLKRALGTRLPGSIVGVSSDAFIALRAGVPSGDGMVLIAGTGSMAYASVGGKTFSSGGFGHLLGDEGSAFAIGGAALRLVLRSYEDRSPRTALVEALEAHLHAHDTETIISDVYDGERPVTRIAALAKRVLELANDGERDAVKIVQTGALELFGLVTSLAKRAELHAREFPLAFAGGMLSTNTILSYLLETRIASDLPLAHIVKNAPAPQFAALALARSLLARA